MAAHDWRQKSNFLPDTAFGAVEKKNLYFHSVSSVRSFKSDFHWHIKLRFKNETSYEISIMSPLCVRVTLAAKLFRVLLADSRRVGSASQTKLTLYLRESCPISKILSLQMYRQYSTGAWTSWHALSSPALM